MRLRLLLASCLALAGCQAAPEPVPEEPIMFDDGLPPHSLPDIPRDGWVDCPYLDAQFVAETNGQRVLNVGIDERFTPPACMFWGYAPEPQLTVFVRHLATPEAAMGVVDWAMPIEHTAPAEDPPGWNGGRHGGGEVPDRIGAGYAVAHGQDAVVVFTNQDESVKAQLVAERVIANLGL